MTAKYRFLGGAHIVGIPARDLTATEWKRYGSAIEREEAAIGVTLYERPKAKAKKADESEDTGDGE